MSNTVEETQTGFYTLCGRQNLRKRRSALDAGRRRTAASVGPVRSKDAPELGASQGEGCDSPTAYLTEEKKEEEEEKGGHKKKDETRSGKAARPPLAQHTR